jgi:serine/threonine protein kinase
MARHVRIGEPAHDLEAQGIRSLVEGLPASYTVFSNGWLVEESGVIYEFDAVVLAPHGLYVVELKCHATTVKGNDHDWYMPSAVPSPLKLNRKTAQILATRLKAASYDAGRRWVEHLVFLPYAKSIEVTGLAAKGRVHGKASILTELQDVDAFRRRAGRAAPEVDDHTRAVVEKALTDVDPRNPPPRRIREYRLLRVRERTERWVEYDAEHELLGASGRRVLRVYPPRVHATPELREKEDRAQRWEAQVLARVGSHRYVLDAEAPFQDGAGICIPFEAFQGVTLGTWVEHRRVRRELSGKDGLAARVGLFDRIAEAIEHAHGQGVVHRLLRPEVVLVAERADAPDIRVTGFELAKQVGSGLTVAITQVTDERARWAAPEVVQLFADASKQADQFSLGAILGFLVASQPLFDTTAELVRRGGAVTRLRDLNPAVPSRLDEVLQRMLRIRAAERFGSVAEARAAVREALQGRAPELALPMPGTVDPENLQPGTRVGADYEIREKLGAGGLATVYSALHLPTGSARALKVARPGAEAQVALQGEHEALKKLDHVNIVRPVNLTGNLFQGQLVLELERVSGEPLSKVLARGEDLDPRVQRQWAENLIAALTHLEQAGVTHKDLKPDNLIAGKAGLTVIDFSLAGHPPDAQVGTAMYRDPSSTTWDSDADRYAAAICLFELYAGHHPFGSQVHEPGDPPPIDPDEFDSPGLAAFFEQALSPHRVKRFQSVTELRDAFLRALGGGPGAGPEAMSLDASASDAPGQPLSKTPISATARTALARAGIVTQGDLVALEPDAFRRISGLGSKKRKEILTFREALVARGVLSSRPAAAARRTLWPALEANESELRVLKLPEVLEFLLWRAGYETVGRLASATSTELTALEGVGRGKVAQIVEALQRFAEARGAGVGSATETLAAVWSAATGPLQGHQQAVLELTFGLRGEGLTQTEIGARLDLTQGTVSHHLLAGLRAVDRRSLGPLVDLVRATVDTSGGIARVSELGQLIEERWAPDEVLSGAGFVHLMVRLIEPELTIVSNPDDDAPLAVSAPYTTEALEGFVKTARNLAGTWEPAQPDAIRRTLRAVLPEYPHDPLALATRLLSDVLLTESEELFEAPIELGKAVKYVLRRARLPIAVEEVARRVEANFREGVHSPSLLQLEELVRRNPAYRVQDGLIITPDAVPDRERLPSDPTPAELLVATKSEEETLRDLLREFSKRQGWRLLVAPPERHRQLSRSVAAALGPDAVFVSFEERLIDRMERAGFEVFEAAERYKAQRGLLRNEADALLEELVSEHGKPGQAIVLGDLGILALCDARDLPRRLYDQTTERNIGSWALVLPGVIHERQPLLNERPDLPVFGLDGKVYPLRKLLPT